MHNMSLDNKHGIALFIHDAAKIEQKAFTLRALAQKCDSAMDIEISNVKNEISRWGEKIKEVEQLIDLANYQIGLENDQQYSSNVGELEKIFAGFGINMIVTVVVFVLFMITGVLENTFISAAILIIGFIVMIIVRKSKIRSMEERSRNEFYQKQRNRIEENRTAIKNNESIIANMKAQREKCISHLNILYAREKALNHEAAMYRDAAKRISNNLKTLYQQTSIIPPDYRSMDCVLAFDQIFRNDLADNLREAVKIYEERVFRGEVIRGMDRICAQLNYLNSSMDYMRVAIDNINSNVSMMSQDVFLLTQKLDSLSEAQERMYEHAKATRYAAEAVKESQEKCEAYIRK